ncbi:hypothetical protein GCM10028806_34480 [Spirosoma terrae]|uniref:Uncharacterized protein n=1 Tax=Spirosoma terrae TaxID=1968276 RepID=A0A6L9L8R5_9BACT|nr:hypothetical protein [Spirosoma terrae]NDU95762.1 hypothetical protein [Spirosoma terrae]
MEINQVPVLPDRLNEITKNLDRFRAYNLYCLVGVCVCAVSTLSGKLTHTALLEYTGIILGAVSAFGAAFFSNKTNGITRALVIEANQQITSVQDQLRFVEASQNESNNWLSGSESYGVILFSIAPTETDNEFVVSFRDNDPIIWVPLSRIRLKLFFFQCGIYPLYNVSIYRKEDNWPSTQITPNYIITETNKFVPTYLGELVMDITEPIKLDFHIFSRNKSWEQSIEIDLKQFSENGGLNKSVLLKEMEHPQRVVLQDLQLLPRSPSEFYSKLFIEDLFNLFAIDSRKKLYDLIRSIQPL